MGSKELPPEQENPLKWPACANLGKELCDSILPALRSLTPALTDAAEHSPQYIEAARQTAMAELDSVGDWLDAPCSATVKLDGTNLGVGVYWEVYRESGKESLLGETTWCPGRNYTKRSTSMRC